jgi:tetratricopeptide (TPR) repeat protein
MKVFLSSTYLDLIEHRKAVVNALRTMDEEVGHMEVFGARDDEATTVSLEELDKCDVLVGVYAYRYGTIPTGSKASVTEQEYLHAMSKKIPVLVFVVDESHLWPPKSMDKSLSKINKFKSKATKEHTPDYFTSPDNLAQKVVSSIGRLAKKLSPKPISDSPLPTYESHKPTGNTLPTQPYLFGRADELKIIASALSHESRTWGALIDGPGGIGKTALAIKAAHDAPAELFERKIFITAKVRELTPEGEKPLKDFSRDNYFSMLDELALELGEDEISRLAPDQRANQLRMAMAGKKTLIVFDNLETLQEDERDRLFQFLSRLPEGNKAIATSRRRRSDVDARAIRLDRLSADEAFQLMNELAKNNSRLAREDETARRKLYEITHGNPLLVKWVCGQLGREGSAMHTIEEACAFIEKAPKGNDPLEYIFGDLLVTFTESETKVLAALTHFAQPAKLAWISQMTDMPESSTQTALEDLTDRSILISNTESQTFYLPPLAAQFIKTRRPDAVTQTGDALTDRAYALAMQYGGEDDYEGFPMLDAEWDFISAALPRLLTSDNDRLQTLCDQLFPFFSFTGKWDEAIWLSEQAESCTLAAGDKDQAGWRAIQAAMTYYNRNQAAEVLVCTAHATEHWQDSTPRNKAIIISLRGRGYELSEDYPAAIAAHREVLAIIRTISPETDDDVSIALSDLAGAESANNDYEAAERDYREALPLSEKVGRQELIAINCHRLAIALLKQNRNLDEALSLSRRAVEIYTRLRSPRLQGAQETLAEIEKAIHE